MEESQKETQTTSTPAPTQTAVQDVVMEEATPTASASNSNEKDNKVQTDPATVAMNNQRIVEEFQYLLEKSQQLFAGLR
jgi:hypothetical protein